MERLIWHGFTGWEQQPDQRTERKEVLWMIGKEQSLLTGEVYDWVASMECARIGEEPHHIYFDNGSRRGAVSFYEGYIIELSVEDEETGETPFYIHFAIRDVKETKDRVRLFFRSLEGEMVGQERIDLSTVRTLCLTRILVSCSCGITSSYFALLMQQAADRAGLRAEVRAVGLEALDQLEEQYDQILLAPQVGYMLTSCRERYGDKVQAIDIADFASRNMEHVLRQAVQRAHGASCPIMRPLY